MKSNADEGLSKAYAIFGLIIDNHWLDGLQYSKDVIFIFNSTFCKRILREVLVIKTITQSYFSIYSNYTVTALFALTMLCFIYHKIKKGVPYIKEKWKQVSTQGFAITMLYGQCFTLCVWYGVCFLRRSFCLHVAHLLVGPLKRATKC